MAAPWFRVESNMATHPKVYRLAELLKISCAAAKPNVIAAGMLIGLWSWATQNAADGDLTGVPASAIAEAAGWQKKPQVFVDALIEARLADCENGELWLHDWINYAQLLAEQENKKKADTAERVRKHREAKRRSANVTETEGNAPCNAECNSYSNVTETQCNAPYITEHNITVHNSISNQNREDSIPTVSNPGCNGYNDASCLPASESWEEMKQRIDAQRMERSGA